MSSFVRALMLGLLAMATGGRGEGPLTSPWLTSMWNVETGVLWQVGTGTPIPYRLVPTQLAWRSGEIWGRSLPGGSRVVLRHRFGLIGTWVQEGPETYYAGVTASPSIEWWNPAGTWALFGGAGGGLGVVDSTDVTGGQGQDFTLNWFMRGGVEWVISPRSSVVAGILFQHLSNGGQTDPNPGIDALGFSFGWSWRY